MHSDGKIQPPDGIELAEVPSAPRLIKLLEAWTKPGKTIWNPIILPLMCQRHRTADIYERVLGRHSGDCVDQNRVGFSCIANLYVFESW